MPDSPPGQSLHRPWQGIIPALVSPLTAGVEVNEDALAGLIESVISAGVSALSVGGSTGEGPLLPRAVRLQLVQASASIVGRRIALLSGTPGGPPTDVVDEGRAHLERGASCLLVPPPSYFQLDQASVVAYYEQVAAGIGGPIIAYHFPALTKVTFSVATVAALAAIDGVVGIKDSSGDEAFLAEVVIATAGRRDFAVLAGSGRVLTSAFRSGARGAVAASANLIPEQLVRLWAALGEGREEDARGLQVFASEVEAACRRHPYPVNWKEALDLGGVRCGPAAPPLHRLSAEESAELRRSLQQLGVGLGAGSGSPAAITTRGDER